MSDDNVIEAIDKMIADTEGKLEALTLKGCKIPAFTASIKQKIQSCTDLISLELTNCMIESLHNFPTLPKLTKLDISGNMFTGSELTNLAICVPNLQELHIRDNKIQEYDEVASLAQLKNLNDLSLAGCELSKKADYQERMSSLVPSLQMLDGSKVSEAGLGERDPPKDSVQGEQKEEYVCSLHYNAPYILYCGEASCSQFKLCEFCCTTHEHQLPQRRVGVATVKSKLYEKLARQLVEEYDILEQSEKEKLESFTQKVDEYYAAVEKKLLDSLASFRENLLSSHREIVANIIKETKLTQALWKNHKDALESLELNYNQPEDNKVKEYLRHALTAKQDLTQKEASNKVLSKKVKESEDGVFKMIDGQFERLFASFSSLQDNKENKLEDNILKTTSLFSNAREAKPEPKAEFKFEPSRPTGQEKLTESSFFTNKSESTMEESKSSQKELFGQSTNFFLGATPRSSLFGNVSSGCTLSKPAGAPTNSSTLFGSVLSGSVLSSRPQNVAATPEAFSDSSKVEMQNVIKALIAVEPNIKKIMGDKNEWKRTCSVYHTSSTYYHVNSRYWVASLVNSMYEAFEQISTQIAKLHSIDIK